MIMEVRRLKKPCSLDAVFLNARHKSRAYLIHRSFGNQLPKHLQISCWSCKSQFVGLMFVQLVHWTLSSTFVCPVSLADGGGVI